MAEFKITLTRRDVILIYALSGIFVLELLILLLLIYYSRFPLFIAIFITSLRTLSPIFLCVNIIFLISMIFIKGKKLIVQSWKLFWSELVSYSILSFVITIFLMTLSALLGTFFTMLLRRISHVPTMQDVLTSLRIWVDQTFHDDDTHMIRMFNKTQEWQ